MRKKILASLAVVTFLLGTTGSSFGVVIDFAGGTATLSGGSTVTTTNSGLWQNVDYYEEGGIKVDFIGGLGIIGDYYSTAPGGTTYLNSVIHSHWNVTGGLGTVTSIVFTKPDGAGVLQTFDLNYVDITSNCVIGGGQSNGTELSYITPLGGSSVQLPSSDWGFAYDYFGVAGDGVEHVNFGASFDNITAFTITSQNAICFGMDNFYIDEPAPIIPAPGAILLGSIGVGLVGLLRRRRTL